MCDHRFRNGPEVEVAGIGDGGRQCQRRLVRKVERAIEQALMPVKVREDVVGRPGRGRETQRSHSCPLHDIYAAQDRRAQPNGAREPCLPESYSDGW